MQNSATASSPVQTGAMAGGYAGDRLFHLLTLGMALSVFALLILVGYELSHGSMLALRKFGWHFLSGEEWNPVSENFGALNFIYGTIVSALIGLLIAVPLSIATALYLTELAPLRIRQPITILIELLAAVPSVILGLWGIYVMVPWLRHYFYPGLRAGLGFLPLFHGTIYGPSMLSAGIVLAIMILPIITSVSREILRSVPGLQREAAYALGATRWEVTRIAVLSYARKGLFGAVILGLGRALGETMAVLMVIGGTPQIKASLFAPAATLSTWIASQFSEATGNMYPSALFELGLVLLGVTVVVNALAQILLKTFSGPQSRPQN